MLIQWRDKWMSEWIHLSMNCMNHSVHILIEAEDRAPSASPIFLLLSNRSISEVMMKGMGILKRKKKQMCKGHQMEKAIKKEAVLFFLFHHKLRKAFSLSLWLFLNLWATDYFKWALCYVINIQTGDANCSLWSILLTWKSCARFSLEGMSFMFNVTCG